MKGQDRVPEMYSQPAETGRIEYFQYSPSNTPSAVRCAREKQCIGPYQYNTLPTGPSPLAAALFPGCVRAPLVRPPKLCLTNSAIQCMTPNHHAGAYCQHRCRARWWKGESRGCDLEHKIAVGIYIQKHLSERTIEGKMAPSSGFQSMENCKGFFSSTIKNSNTAKTMMITTIVGLKGSCTPHDWAVQPNHPRNYKTKEHVEPKYSCSSTATIH